jgi:hypothetical protein
MNIGNYLTAKDVIVKGVKNVKLKPVIQLAEVDKIEELKKRIREVRLKISEPADTFVTHTDISRNNN